MAGESNNDDTLGDYTFIVAGCAAGVIFLIAFIYLCVLKQFYPERYKNLCSCLEERSKNGQPQIWNAGGH